MELIDWIAVLGALAWTPHMFGILRKWLVRSKITIIAPKAAEIGFSSLGPIFNINLAFAVNEKEIVISSIKIRVKHESGETRDFDWHGIQQELMKMQGPDGSTVPYQRSNSVLALKLTEKDIEERFIQFQDTEFHNKRIDLEQSIYQNVSHLREQQLFSPSAVIKSQEMQDLIKFIKQSFTWKPGKYTATIMLGSSDDFELAENTYSFFLTPLDVSELEKNKLFIERYYSEQIDPPASNSELIRWNWRNRPLKKSS